MTTSRQKQITEGHAAPAHLRSRAYVLLVFAACLAIAWLTYGTFQRAALLDTQERGASALERHAQDLLASVERFEHLPYLLGAEQVLATALQAPEDPRLLDAANSYLAFAQQRTDVFAIYLMDTTGQTLAASNWNTPLSFVGKNYRFRPYFQDALAGSTGRFYGIGVTTGEPGFFIAAPVRAGQDVIGVVAVKIDLNAYEDKWRAEGLKLAVTDNTGVLFMSAEPSWRYRSLYPLDDGQLARLRDIRQYGDNALLPLVEHNGPAPSRHLEALRVAGVPTLMQGRNLDFLGWKLLLFSDPGPARTRGALAAGISVLALALIVMVAALGWTQRRRRLEQEASRQEKVRMVAELENRIATRTAELTAANDAAVQTGKLALLGQMAAGISHELSQPLTALRTMADNAVTFLDRQDTPNAQRNLRLIGELCSRMGSIVGELKSFARKEPVRLQAVSLQQVMRSTLMLLEPLRQATECDIRSDGNDAMVLCDPIRLEQVLANLLRNGMEAMEPQDTRLLEVHVSRGEDMVTVSVRDHGPGLSDDVLHHLFEPFFTTKPTGKGLGLGLALSLAIVREMGGSIQARNGSPGAVFDITLQLATP